MHMRLGLAIASFVILIVHGVVFYDQFFYRWERHQTAYFEQIGRATGRERLEFRRVLFRSHMRLALAIASFVILIVHGVVFYDQFFYRWERHQTAYFEQARSLSKNEAERGELEARSPRIEQTLVTSFGDTRVDRCTTCHIASDDPRFAGHAQPLKTHPFSAAMGDVQRNGRWERRHRFSDFGCIVCHDGQGRGLETKYSHGEDEFWPEPLT